MTKELKKPLSPIVAKHEPHPFPPLSLSIGSAAKAVGVSKTTYYKLMAEEGAPGFHLGKRYLVSTEALAEWVRIRQEKGGAAC